MALGNSSIVNRLNWEDPKRNIVGSLVDFLSRDENQHQDALIQLMVDVAAINDFTHLESLEAGESKAESARVAVKALRVYTEAHQDIINEQDVVARQRQLAGEKRLQTKAVSDA